LLFVEIKFLLRSWEEAFLRSSKRVPCGVTCDFRALGITWRKEFAQIHLYYTPWKMLFWSLKTPWKLLEFFHGIPARTLLLNITKNIMSFIWRKNLQVKLETTMPQDKCYIFKLYFIRYQPRCFLNSAKRKSSNLLGTNTMIPVAPQAKMALMCLPAEIHPNWCL
jgi:hypothetical protein